MPPRKKQPSGPKPVVATTYDDKRTNIPTADAQEFVAPDVEAPRKVRWDRDHSLDPQLVWKGKDFEADVLEGDAPPIYIQEKVDPRVLVENLRRTAAANEPEPELTLFDTFDGLDELDAVDFYRHDANWSNRMILGDSLNVMASLAERERLRGKVQMIYVDPPYGIKFGSNWQVSARKRDVKDGKVTDASRQVEQIKAFRDTWELGINSYLAYLRDRLLVARDLLTESGSCFVQIGDENVHLVRSLMDEVFGSENFVSLITYSTTSSATADLLPGTTDFIVWFAKHRPSAKYRSVLMNKQLGGAGASKYDQAELPGGTRMSLGKVQPEEASTARPFRHDNLTSQSQGRAKGLGAASWFEVELEGQTFTPGIQSRWKTNEQGMNRLRLASRLAVTGKTLAYVRFLDDFPAFGISNSWNDIGGIQSRADPKIYVVQTARRAIERCMHMCTDPGDLVLDPTCGSGTTANVAEQWGRRWITIDTSRVALALARQRLMGAKFPYYLLADSAEGRLKEGQVTGTALPDSHPTDDIRHGFVYERVQHVTLKSIANNPDIVEGMSRSEIDSAIKRHADFELLYDKPYESNNKVRVTGPFTVESLSPHRSLAFAGGPDEADVKPAAEQAGEDDVTGADFTQTILDNLAEAGIQNGQRQERIELESVEPYAGEWINAVGIRKAPTSAAPEAADSAPNPAGATEGDSSTADSEQDGAAAPPTKVGISLGPQYGTVSARWVKDAAREAIQAGDIDLLCILAFAFDPNVLGTSVDGANVETDLDTDDFASVADQRQMGRVPVLLVRMNADLVMGEELKKTGAGNLFTVFGEPDIEIVEADNQLTVTLHGVDVYDPSTGEVRSRDTDQIALWMIDSDYDGESFYVRHAYFTGGQDPYKKLKRALKAEIDEEVWAGLYRTESRPFPKPSTGRIAVKVINDYGDEVLQVFDLSTVNGGINRG
ncbi:site-specific DNA-methyltransferase [Candidatus Microthrix parvicella]|uniref:site-specific DNA-methyltransferase n=1 Tax=Candidatus Neomicrothrix parvicella TaxID=41950 RepID=UPI0004B11321|nr:site-specific DNA-methyltransferase [Candidatus Microthrix parvicella]